MDRASKDQPTSLTFNLWAWSARLFFLHRNVNITPGSRDFEQSWSVKHKSCYRAKRRSSPNHLPLKSCFSNHHGFLPPTIKCTTVRRFALLLYFYYPVISTNQSLSIYLTTTDLHFPPQFEPHSVPSWLYSKVTIYSSLYYPFLSRFSNRSFNYFSISVTCFSS